MFSNDKELHNFRHCYLVSNTPKERAVNIFVHGTIWQWCVDFARRYISHRVHLFLLFGTNISIWMGKSVSVCRRTRLFGESVQFSKFVVVCRRSYSSTRFRNRSEVSWFTRCSPVVAFIQLNSSSIIGQRRCDWLRPFGGFSLWLLFHHILPIWLRFLWLKVEWKSLRALKTSEVVDYHINRSAKVLYIHKHLLNPFFSELNVVLYSFSQSVIWCKTRRQHVEILSSKLFVELRVYIVA